jgi:hypothetical protein
MGVEQAKDLVLQRAVMHSSLLLYAGALTHRADLWLRSVIYSGVVISVSSAIQGLILYRGIFLNGSIMMCAKDPRLAEGSTVATVSLCLILHCQKQEDHLPWDSV